MSEQEMEGLRLKARRRDRIAIAVSAAFLGVQLVLTAWLVIEAGEAFGADDLASLGGAVLLEALLAAGLYMLLYFAAVRQACEKFNRAFKQTCVLDVIRGMGVFDDLSYVPGKGFSYNEVWDSCVVAAGEAKYFESEDLLTGRYRGMPFAYGDVVTKYLRRSGKKTREEIIFCGQIIRLSLPEGAKWSFGHLQVFEKELLSNLKGRTAPHRVQVEDEAFNRRFQVFAADEHNAFYLLTPQMLEQIVRFADAADCQTALTFVGRSLYVAVNSMNSIFDAALKTPVAQQLSTVRAEAEQLRRAGELLVLEADGLSRMEHS